MLVVAVTVENVPTSALTFPCPAPVVFVTVKFFATIPSNVPTPDTGSM